MGYIHLQVWKIAFICELFFEEACHLQIGDVFWKILDFFELVSWLDKKRYLTIISKKVVWKVDWASRSI